MTEEQQQHEHGEGGDAVTRKQLATFFESMPYNVPLYLFIDPALDNVFTRGARQTIVMVKSLTPRVSLKEYNLDHQLAHEWGVTFSPTIVFCPEQYRIHWLGAPLGEEGRTFVEAVIMLGRRDHFLGAAARGILEKMQGPRAVKVFVSPTCPYCPQQAVNAMKAAIARPDLISLEIIDVQANLALAEKYQAHSVPQVYANETLIAMGAQTEELFMASLDRLEEQTVFIPDNTAEEVAVDLVIVGGGPAGLTAGIYAERSGLKTAIIERGTLGGQVATTPVVENYPGFTQIGGKALVDIMVSHALEYATIFPGEEVMEILAGTPMVVKTSRRRFTGKAVLLATGARHRKLGVPGEERLAGRGVSYCSTCDGPLFKGGRAVIVGGGNSALTEALHLNNIGVEVTVLHRRESLRAQEQLAANARHAGIPILFNTVVEEIVGQERVEAVSIRDRKTGILSRLEVSAVFVAIGYEPTTDLARKVGVELTTDGFIRHDQQHRTSIPNLYSAGDVAGGYKQIVTAAGQGAAAALAIFEDLIIPYWKTGKPS